MSVMRLCDELDIAPRATGVVLTAFSAAWLLQSWRDFCDLSYLLWSHAWPPFLHVTALGLFCRGSLHAHLNLQYNPAFGG